jgi:hypothetical protein
MSTHDGSPKPETPLSKRLDDLGLCWLELRGCCQIVYMPLPLLAQKRGGGLILGDVVARLRCSKCGRRPPIVALVERPEPNRESWRIMLREEPAARQKGTIVDGNDHRRRLGQRIVFGPAYDEIDIAPTVLADTSRLPQSGTVVSALYRSAISAGSGSTWWRPSLHQTREST